MWLFCYRAQKLRNDRPGGRPPPLPPRQFRHCLLNFNITDIFLSGNPSSCNAMFFNPPQWITPFCPCFQQQSLQEIEKLNNLASKRSSSLIRSFSNVAIVTMLLQQQKSKLKNIWNSFSKLVAKIQFSGRLSQTFERGSICALLLCVLFTFWHQ